MEKQWQVKCGIQKKGASMLHERLLAIPRTMFTRHTDMCRIAQSRNSSTITIFPNSIDAVDGTTS
jgi:hypothetical protein